MDLECQSTYGRLLAGILLPSAPSQTPIFASILTIDARGPTTLDRISCSSQHRKAVYLIKLILL